MLTHYQTTPTSTHYVMVFCPFRLELLSHTECVAKTLNHCIPMNRTKRTKSVTVIVWPESRREKISNNAKLAKSRKLMFSLFVFNYVLKLDVGIESSCFFFILIRCCAVLCCAELSHEYSALYAKDIGTARKWEIEKKNHFSYRRSETGKKQQQINGFCSSVFFFSRNITHSTNSASHKCINVHLCSS